MHKSSSPRAISFHPKLNACTETFTFKKSMLKVTKLTVEANSEPSQTSKMELFAKKETVFNP